MRETVLPVLCGRVFYVRLLVRAGCFNDSDRGHGVRGIIEAHADHNVVYMLAHRYNIEAIALSSLIRKNTPSCRSVILSQLAIPISGYFAVLI